MARSEQENNQERQLQELAGKFCQKLLKPPFFKDAPNKQAELVRLLPQLQVDLVNSWNRILFASERLDFANWFVGTAFAPSKMWSERSLQRMYQAETVANGFVILSNRLIRQQFGGGLTDAPAAQEEDLLLPWREEPVAEGDTLLR